MRRRLIPRRRPGAADLMLALGLAVALGIGVLAALQLADARQDAWDRAEAHGRNLATALRRDIETLVESLDLSLRTVVDSLDHDGAGGTAEAMHRLGLLRQDPAGAAQRIRRVLILDAVGDVRFDSLPAERIPANLAAREFFQAHQDDPRLGLHVTRPFPLINRPGHAIGLSRRLDDAAGRFRGVAVAIVPLDALQALFAGLAIGPGSSITLHRRDGTTLVRMPFRPEDVGRNVFHGAAFQRFLQAPHGQFTAVAAIDGIERLYSFTEIEGAPLILNVALARAAIEAHWRPRAHRIGVATAILVLGLLAALLWLRREVARRHVAQQEAARARDAAEAAGRARAQFLAVMSHEIRTPMNGVIGMTELLLGTGLSAEQVGYLTTLRTSAEHMTELLTDILDFSRLEAGRLEYEAIAFDPAELGRGACRMLAGPAARKGLRLEFDGPAAPPWLRGDPARLRQVLLNLLSNAIKFTESGQVRLELDPPAAAEGGLLLRMRVVDTGIGIAPEALPRLFEPFTQADGSIARRFGGSGLGLSICRHLVEGMGGSIGAESRPGAGSTFHVRLVLPEAERPALAAVPAAEAVPPRPLRILLAEDDATNRLVILGMLRRLGHAAEAADDGAAALEALAARRFDLVLMDMMMPEVDGLEATRRIRAAAAPWRGLPVIGVSANASPEDAAACRAAGMDDFVTKPLTLEALEAALGRHAPAAPAAPAARAEGSFRPEILLGYAAQLGPRAAAEIRDGFVAEARDRLTRLAAALQAPDPPVLRREAHSLKSSAGALGLPALSEAAARLERAAAEGGATAALLAEVEAQVEAGMEWLGALELPAEAAA